MNESEIALFLAFYFYLLSMTAACNTQKTILLSLMPQIRALQAQYDWKKNAAVVLHCTDSEVRTNVPSCICNTYRTEKNMNQQHYGRLYPALTAIYGRRVTPQPS